MELIWQGIVKAVELVFGLDAEIWEITWLSLKISGSATLISLLLGVPLGIALALIRFRGRNTTVALINTGMGLPPVVVGYSYRFFVAQRSPGIHGTDLLADGDGDRSGDHCISHSRRLEPGKFPGTRSKARATIARHRRVETATVMAFV